MCVTGQELAFNSCISYVKLWVQTQNHTTVMYQFFKSTVVKGK